MVAVGLQGNKDVLGRFLVRSLENNCPLARPSEEAATIDLPSPRKAAALVAGDLSLAQPMGKMNLADKSLFGDGGCAAERRGFA